MSLSTLKTVREWAVENDWKAEPLADLIDHIKRTHHKYTPEEIARLGPLFDKVVSVHGQRTSTQVDYCSPGCVILKFSFSFAFCTMVRTSANSFGAS